jgi:hypothetical protein
MSGMRRRGSWRWAVAAVVIGVIVLGLGVALRAAGLGAAANAAQVVSLAPLMTGVVGWARSRHTGQGQVRDRPATLGELLRTIADAQGLTSQDLRELVQGWSGELVDAYMDGIRRPGWDFVMAFLDVIAGDDRWRREVLERRIRPVWEAATNVGSHGREAEGTAGEGVVVVMPENGDWIAALRNVARTRRVVGRLSVSIRRHEGLGTGLAEMLDRLSLAVTSLAAERDSLRLELAARRSDDRVEHLRGQVQAELESLRGQLRYAQQRLDETERIRAETARRLEISELQRRLAERLRDVAIAQAEQDQRRLAELEGYPAPTIPRLPGIPQLTEGPETVLMGNNDRQVAEEILEKIDRVLSDESESLGHMEEELARTPPPESAPDQKIPQVVGNRARLLRLVVVGATCIIAAEAVIGIIVNQLTPHRTFLSFAQYSPAVVPWCSTFSGRGAIPKGYSLLIFDSAQGSKSQQSIYSYDGIARATARNSWSIGPVYIGARDGAGFKGKLDGILVTSQTAEFVNSTVAFSQGSNRGAFWGYRALPAGLAHIRLAFVRNADIRLCAS